MKISTRLEIHFEKLTDEDIERLVEACKRELAHRKQ